MVASAWRQGFFVSPSDAVALGLASSAQAFGCRVVVITHSCDLANPNEGEAEVIVGSVVDAALAKGFANGHSTRKLSLESTPSDGQAEFSLLEFSSKRSVPRAKLNELQPWDGASFSLQSRKLLQRWLAQRYARAEFPDAFNHRLQSTGVESKLDSLAKSQSKHIRSIYFDLDTDEEKTDPSDAYELGVYFVYRGGNDASRQQAELAAGSLDAFVKARCHSIGAWKWIELIHCKAISDEAFSIAAANAFRRYRLEHRSVNGEPSEGEA